jgi:hypothetical protein
VVAGSIRVSKTTAPSIGRRLTGLGHRPNGVVALWI